MSQLCHDSDQYALEYQLDWLTPVQVTVTTRGISFPASFVQVDHGMYRVGPFEPYFLSMQ